MADQQLVDLLKQGVFQWNAWREQHRERAVDLSGVDLSGVDLSGAILSGAHLRGADLSEVRAFDTVFAGLDLRGVRGLGEIWHEGPSRVELYSVQLSQDGSAEFFHARGGRARGVD